MTDNYEANGGSTAENNNINNTNYSENNAGTSGAGEQAQSGFDTPRAQGTVGVGSQSYHAPGYNGGETPRSGEYSFRPTESRFDPHENIPRRETFSGSGFNSGSGNGSGSGSASGNGSGSGFNPGAPSQHTEGKHAHGGKPPKEKRGMGKGAIALLIAACIVVSGAAGFGGAMLANKGGSGSPSVIYKTPDTGTVSSDDGGSTSGLPAIVEKVGNSVVEIVTEQVATNSFFGQYVTKGAGSGVIISSDGNIITCAHVIDGASTITVKTADGTSYTAKTVGSDSQTDIAVIKIDATELSPAVIGDSSKLVVGEQAIAVGNPLGELGGTVTNGIISALERQVKIDGTTYTLLQTSAAINPGNSGGALFNGSGELIGIVNAKEAGSSIEGLGFAIPINSAMTIAEDLLTNGYVSGRPQLGVVLAEVNSNTSLSNIRNSEYSALMNYITDYGVYFIKYADGVTGDLQFGDRIVAIDNISVSSRADVKALLAEYEVGDTVTLTVSRVEDIKIGRATITEIQATLTEAQANS